MENITKDDLKGFKKLARVMLELSEQQLELLLKNREIEEIK
jgi:hypothetical protein